MRKLLTVLLLLSASCFAQIGLATSIRSGSSLPTACGRVGSIDYGSLFYKTTSTIGHYECTVAGNPGTWRLIYNAGTGGTVTSVTVTVPSPLSASGCTITTSGTCAITWGSGQIPAANVGSGTPSATKVLQGDSSWVDRPYIIPVQFETAPTANQTARHVITGGVGTVSIATNCPNCTFAIGTAATATTTFTLKKNGSSFGTVAVTSGGSVTWTVTATTFTSGDVITIVAQAVPDLTAAQIVMSLYATR
jgi:hypothetical protein